MQSLLLAILAMNVMQIRLLVFGTNLRHKRQNAHLKTNLAVC